MSDPAKYRTKEEVESFKERDPIDEIKNILISEHNITEELLKDIDKKIRSNIAEVITRCENAPLPDPKELYTDIYSA